MNAAAIHLSSLSPFLLNSAEGGEHWQQHSSAVLWSCTKAGILARVHAKTLPVTQPKMEYNHATALPGNPP